MLKTGTVRESLAGFITMKGTLDLKVTRVLQASDLALVVGVRSFAGTGPDGAPVTLAGHNPDVLRRQTAPGALSSTTPGERTEGR